jgi:hypothetical protein
MNEDGKHSPPLLRPPTKKKKGRANGHVAMGAEYEGGSERWKKSGVMDEKIKKNEEKVGRERKCTSATTE